MDCRNIEFEREQSKAKLEYYINRKKVSEDLLVSLQQQIDITQDHARDLWRKYITAQTPEIKRTVFNERGKILKDLQKQSKLKNDTVTAVEGLQLQIQLTQNEFDDLNTVQDARCTVTEQDGDEE